MHGWWYLGAYILIFLRYYVALVVLRLLRALLPAGAIVIVAFSLTVGGNSFQTVEKYARLVESGKSVDILLVALGELFIGLSLGLPLAIACESFTLFGRIADRSRGAQLADQLVPALEERVSPLENLMALGTLLFVLNTGSFHALMFSLTRQASWMSLFDSVSQKGSAQSILRGSTIGGDSLLFLSAKAIAEGLLIASPVLLAVWFIDLAGLYLMRILGRVNINQELLSLKLLAGLLVFAYCMIGLRERSVSVFRQALATHG